MTIRIEKRGSAAVLDAAASLGRPLAARAQQAKPAIRRLLALSGVVLAASTTTCSASPCSPEIERLQTRLDTRLETKADAGPSAPESRRALRHDQPTPRSIASAEAKLGEISPEKAKIIRESMARAREADQAGDNSVCEQALAEVRRTIRH
jgi:type II secretory pathway component PulM